MLRRASLALLPLLLGVAATVPLACAATPREATPGHPCTPADFYMQCAAPAHLPRLEPPKGAVVALGVDFGWGGPPARELRAQGYRFAASYLSPDSSKNWRRSQVQEYHRAGIATVAVWESTASRATQGYGAGRADARAAAVQAASLGEPPSRPIYFAVDCECLGVTSYFRGVASVIGRDRVGAGYGGIETIRELFRAGVIRYAWQTAAWSRGRWDPRAQIEQFGFSEKLDVNRAIARDYGQWPYAPPKPRPHPKPGPKPRPNPRIAYLRALARKHGCYRHGRKPHACAVWAAEVRLLLG